MKKLLTKFIGATAALAMVIGVGFAFANSNKEIAPVYADEAAFGPSDFSGQGISGSGGAISATVSGVTFACNKGYGTTQVRCYSGGKITISSSYTITSISFEWSGSYTGGLDASYTSLATTSWEQTLSSQLRMTSCRVAFSTGSEPVDSISVSLDKTSMNLDVNGNASGSIKATATATGEATTGLTAVSDAPLVATVSTATPTSGTPFTITALSEGTAHITVTSAWDENVSASCTVNVVDTTPRLANFIKVDSLESGQKVLITTVVNGDYYYLSSNRSTSDAPAAIPCSYNEVAQRIQNANAKMAFTVSGDSSAWNFTSLTGDKLYISGNDNNRVRIGDTAHTFTATSTSNGFYVKSTSYDRYLGVYNSTDWRCYNSRTAGNYQGSDGEYNCDWINFWIEVEKPAQTISGDTAAYTDSTVTLSSTAASPTWSVVAGDTTAEGAAITSAGVVSVSGAGVVKVKAVHANYDDAYYLITFTVRPVDPFVELNKNSTSGYTGQGDDISFSYDSFNSTLNISSDDETVATINDPEIIGHSGTVHINFVGEGTTAISFKDGSVLIASVSVTVDLSTVTISGLPVTKTVYIGRTFNLGGMITVTPTGSCSNAVIWSSEYDNIATVNASGIVTGVSKGTTDITVTSVSFPSASMTCSVTVDEAPDAYILDFGFVRNTNPTEIKTETAFETAFPYYGNSEVSISGISKVFGESGTMLKLGSGSSTASATFTIPSKYYITSVTIDVSETANELSLNVTSGAAGAETENQTITAGTLTFDDYFGSEKNNVVSIASVGNGAFYLTNITINYAKKAKTVVEDTLSTNAALSYSYNKTNDVFNFTNLVVRVGGKVDQALWERLETESDIKGYGVMITETEYLKGETIVDDYNTYKDLGADIDEAIGYLCDNSKTLDKAIWNYQKRMPEDKANPALVNGSYGWNLVAPIAEEDYTTEYSVVAYIRLADEIIFLDEITFSVKDLAAELLAGDVYDDESLEGSLYYLAHLS